MGIRQKNTPGLGIEYEVHVPAYFALRLNINPEIEDFLLRSNVHGFGNLDDLLVDIRTKSGENLYFAFQLKHRENFGKNLLPTHFEARGSFNLEKYCEAFKKLNEENKKYHFILYTNKNFDSSGTKEVNNFDMRKDECCVGRNFFDTSSDGMNHLYKFEVNEKTEDGRNLKKYDYREFFLKFSLYTGQADARKTEKFILHFLNNNKECYATYIDFFRKWHKDEFTNKILDKKTINVHLVDMFLSSLDIKYYLSDGKDGNSNFFEAMVQQFDVTVLDASKEEFIEQLEKKVHKYPEEFHKEDDLIRLATDSKFIDRFTGRLEDETKQKLQHYFFQKPLILDFNTNSKNQIIEATKLSNLQETGIKLVIMGKDIDVSKFSGLKIFTNLTGIDDASLLEEIKIRCNLSLQGRKISFGEILDDEIREIFTPREIFQMLKGSFSIGEDEEKLPEYYIPRTVSTTVFDIESIIKHSSRSSAIVFYYENKLEKLKILIQNFVRGEDYFYDDFLDDCKILRKKEPSKKQLHQDNSNDTFPEIIILREECSRKKFEEILREISTQEAYSDERRDVHLFKVTDEEKCQLLMSTKNTSLKEKYKSTKMSVEENNIHAFFNNSINILCAQPGMGKSTLMKFLKNDCVSNFWTLRIDLKAHNEFLKINHDIEDVLKYFLELENSQDIFLLNVKKMFSRKKKIVFFLDGLDEVESECVDHVLNITRQLSEMGFRIWLSSRQNLQQKIENYFNMFAIEINKIKKNQQRKYIKERLESQYNENEIEKIVDKIFGNTNLTNNRQILEIPLQLHIITQIFLDDKSYYDNLTENSFILTKMFEIFFEGKYKHYVAKIELSNSGKEKYARFLEIALEDLLKKYINVALSSVLEDEHLQKLDIEKLKLTQNKDWDFLGIITEINCENKAVFEHLTFAEYFVSKFFLKSFERARILREEIFSEKYQNLSIIFNIMLAEESPLHLAIIYKDLSRIQEMHASSVEDKGGRNCIQVAACVATRHPRLEYNSGRASECLMKDKDVQHFKGEDSKIKEIVNHVLSEPFKKDKIFEWDSFDYALAAGALYIVEAILERFKKPSSFYEILHKYYSDEVVAYYSIRFGYHHLLSEILAKKFCQVTKIVSNYLWENGNNSILHFLFIKSECTNRTRIVELLTSGDINRIVYEIDEYTFLHFAIFHDDTELIEFLLGKKADIHIKDKKGRSPLFLAVERNNLEISKLLIERGADVNIKNKNGATPLFCAAELNYLEISKLLLEKTADPNIQDKNGWSPLFCAADRNNLDIAKLLVENGADVNIQDKKQNIALFYAPKQNILEFSKLFNKSGAEVNSNIKNDASNSLPSKNKSRRQSY